MSDAHNFTHRIDAEGVLRIVFDTPGQKVNLLSEATLRALDRLLEETRHRDEIRAVLFTSGKHGMFIAGMDIDQIASVNDAYSGAEAARFGQAVFQKIADLERPSACAINGTCLGGGTELALACSFRVAAHRAVGSPSLCEVVARDRATMPQSVIENPVLNLPFDEPTRHFKFTDESITDEVLEGRRISSYFVPIAQPRKRGKQLAVLPGNQHAARPKLVQERPDIRPHGLDERSGCHIVDVHPLTVAGARVQRLDVAHQGLDGALPGARDMLQCIRLARRLFVHRQVRSYVVSRDPPDVRAVALPPAAPSRTQLTPGQ